MSTIPAKETERNRDKPDRRDRARAASANRTSYHPRKTHRRRECATGFDIVPTAQPTVVRSAGEGLASCGTTPGTLPFAQRSALIVSELVGTTTAGFYPASRLPDAGCGDALAVNFRSSSVRSREVAQ